MIAAIKTAIARRSFRVTIRAAQAALLDGDHARSLEYCGKALALANKRNDKALRGKVMTAMNRVRAEGRRAEPRRYAPIPAGETRGTFEGNLMLATAAVFFAITCATVSFLPMGESRTYDFVEYTGDESDIRDYDLSATDCARLEGQARKAGHVVACELAGSYDAL